MYGLTFGYARSVQWLLAFFSTFAMSALIVQPAKVITIAIIVAWLWKRQVQPSEEIPPDNYVPLGT